MNSFRNIVENISRIWKDATPISRIGLIFLILFCFASIGLVGYWSSQPSYVTLVSDGDLDRVSKVVDELEKKGIAYQLGGAGGVLKVDQRSLPMARVIADGVGVETASADPSSSMGTMWLDPAERKNLEIRKKERMLEATIASYAAIENADVHLNVPVKGPFERRVTTPTASVLVSIRPGQSLSNENVLAIASTVAFAVEQLSPESIRITDKAGRVYSVPDESSGRVGNQMEYTAQQERSLAFKAQQQLTRFFGMGNSSVQISLDYTFIESNQTSTEYDSEGKVAETEDISTESTTSDEGAATGAAGVVSNINDNNTGGLSSTTELRRKKEDLKNKFLVPKTEKTETNNTPVRNYMTVSVLVNDQAPGVLEEGGGLNPNIKTRVEQLVKSAVGFNQDTDQIAVEFAAFPSLETSEAVETPFDWTQLNEVLKNASLAIASIVVFLLGFLTLRKFSTRPGGESSLRVEPGASSKLEQISELAKNNPEVFASVIKAWAGNQNDDSSSTQERSSAA